MRAFIALAALSAVAGAPNAFAGPDTADNVPVTINYDDAYIRRIAARLAAAQPKPQQAPAEQQPLAPPPVTAANADEDNWTVGLGVEFNRYNRSQVSTADQSIFKQYPNNVGWNPVLKWSPFTGFIERGDSYLEKTVKRARVVLSATFNSTAAAGFTAFDHWDSFTNVVDNSDEYYQQCTGTYRGYTYDLGNCYYCGTNGYHGTQYCYDTYTAQYAQRDGQEATFVQGGTAFEVEVPFHFANWIVAFNGGLNLTFLGTGVVEDQLRTTTRWAPTFGGSVAYNLPGNLQAEGNVRVGGVRDRGNLSTVQVSARINYNFKHRDR